MGQYFNIRDEDRGRAYCKIYSFYDTSNLIKHLKTRHSTEYANVSSQFNSTEDGWGVYTSRLIVCVNLFIEKRRYTVQVL